MDETPPPEAETLEQRLARVQAHTLIQRELLTYVTPCERNIVYPCLTKNPRPAKFMVAYADCDCDEPAPPKAYCALCLQETWLKPVSRCDCGTVYRPARAIFETIVQIGG